MQRRPALYWLLGADRTASLCRLVAGWAVWTCAASAQYVVDPARIPPALRDFESSGPGGSLRCQVDPIRPRLDFGFRFHAGYVVRLSLKQFAGASPRITILTRVTPKAGAQRPVYLLSRFTLREIPNTRAELEVGGSFLVGEGQYAVDWLLVDGAGRHCGKRWTTEARLSRSERHVKLRMPPATVRSLSSPGLRNPPAGPRDARKLRFTILLHAAPLSPRGVRLSAYDREMLLGSLSSLVELLPPAVVRLVVFNLDQQTRLFSDDDFGPEDVRGIGQRMRELQLGLVEYKVLQNRRGHLALLADLINEETRAGERPDVVVFLGPAARHLDPFPKSALDERRTAGLRPFYVQHRFSPRRGPLFPDSIQSLVRALGGKTQTVYTPGDFAGAVKQIETYLAQSSGVPKENR